MLCREPQRGEGASFRYQMRSSLLCLSCLGSSGPCLACLVFSSCQIMQDSTCGEIRPLTTPQQPRLSVCTERLLLRAVSMCF